jgi:hypothetical protein
MSYLRSVPKGSIDALTWLGKRAFFKPTPNGYIVSSETIRATLKDSLRFGRRFFEEVALVVLSCTNESETADTQQPSMTEDVPELVEEVGGSSVGDYVP